MAWLSPVPVKFYEFTGRQEERARAHGVTRVFRFRFIAGDVRRLPAYVTNAISAAGYTPVYLGGTTYKYSVIGLVPVSEEDNNDVSAI